MPVAVTLAGAAGLKALAAAKTAAAAAKLAAANALSMAQNLNLSSVEATRAMSNLQHYVFGTPVSSMPPVLLPTNGSYNQPPMGVPGAAPVPVPGMANPAFGSPTLMSSSMSGAPPSTMSMGAPGMVSSSAPGMTMAQQPTMPMGATPYARGFEETACVALVTCNHGIRYNAIRDFL